eukprot:1825263-Rhodomonas_salina.3
MPFWVTLLPFMGVQASYSPTHSLRAARCYALRATDLCYAATRFALAAFAEEPGPAIWRFVVLQYHAQKAMCNHIITRIREVMPGTEKKIKNAALGPGRVDAVLLGRKEGLRLGDGYPLPTGAYYLRDSAAY